MDQPTESPVIAEPSPAEPSPMEWRRAWNALKKLIEDPERTDQVFEIIDALAGNSFERSYQRFLHRPDGARLLNERPSLLAAVSDREALRQLPAGSFGRVYAQFMDEAKLDAAGLVEAEKEAEERNPRDLPDDPNRKFFGDRLRDMHDLWHVLTGYGRDEAGEAANLAFTQAQIPNFGVALIVFTSALIGPKDLRFTWQRYLYSAWQRGKATSTLSVAPYEELLPLPLTEVRNRLGIPPALVAHPEGIIEANDGDQGFPRVAGIGA